MLDADGNVVARREVSDTPVAETETEVASAASAEPVALSADPA